MEAERRRRESVDTDAITGHHHSLHRPDVDRDGYRHNIISYGPNHQQPTRAFHYHRKGSIEAIKQHERTNPHDSFGVSMAAKTGHAAAWDTAGTGYWDVKHTTDPQGASAYELGEAKKDLSYYERIQHDHGKGRKGSTFVAGGWREAIAEMDAERIGERTGMNAESRRGSIRHQERAFLADSFAHEQAAHHTRARGEGPHASGDRLKTDRKARGTPVMIL